MRRPLDMMNLDLIRRLDALAQEHGLAFARAGEACTLTIARDGVRVTLTVPDDVPEWFADAQDQAKEQAGSRQVRDWCDYAGYDDTPPAQLAREMAVEVQAFAVRLLTRPLRWAGGPAWPGPAALLQWRIDGEWRQALPFTGEE